MQDFCDRANTPGYLKKVSKSDHWKYKQRECKQCLSEKGKDARDQKHTPRRLTGLLLWLMDLSGEVNTIMPDLYHLGAIDETDVSLVHKARRFFGGK